MFWQLLRCSQIKEGKYVFLICISSRLEAQPCLRHSRFNTRHLFYSTALRAVTMRTNSPTCGHLIPVHWNPTPRVHLRACVPPGLGWKAYLQAVENDKEDRHPEAPVSHVQASPKPCQRNQGKETQNQGDF